MATKKTTSAPINILEQALAVKGGDAIDAEIFGISFKIKRDFTGDQVHDYITLFTDEGRKDTIKEQIEVQLDMLTDLSDQPRNTIVDQLLKRPVVEASSVMIYIGQQAGLRGADTGFLTGIAPS